jgi:hypothetical protein
MKSPKRLVMDVDYRDMALQGYGGPQELENLFIHCAEAGIQTMVWSTIACGVADYHSRILPCYAGQERGVNWSRAAEVMKRFDPLAKAVELGRKYHISILAYFRMFDHYWPGCVDTTIDRMDHGWWESRCGRFQLRGWPCYSMPEVRDYHLRLVREIALYGVDGFMFGLTRSHSFFASPYRQPDFFGFNAPIAEEYQRRYGVDIRQFDYCEDQFTSEGHLGRSYWPFLHEVRHVGASEFDKVQWHWLKGEGVVEFIRQARQISGKDAHLAIEAFFSACPPAADPADSLPARFFIDPVAMAREGLINEWMIPGAFREVDYETRIFPAFQGVLDAGAEINIWMNDFIASDGGAGGGISTLEAIRQYMRKIQQGKINSFTIHQADFIERHPQAKGIWNLLSKRE